MAFRAWTLVALVGGMAGIVSFVLLRTRLQARYNPRPTRDGWNRGKLALAAYSLALLVLGVGMGGAVASWVSGPWELRWWGPVLPFGSPVDQAASRDPSLDAAWYSMAPPSSRRDSAFAAIPVPVPDSVLAASAERTEREETTLAGRVPGEVPGHTRARPESSDVALPEPVVAEPTTDARGTRLASQPSGAPEVSTEAAAIREDAPAPPATPWAVRVGVFRQTGNVDGLVANLRRTGFSPLVVRRLDRAERPVYYLYAVTYVTRARAVEAARELRNRGIEAMVVEIDTGETANVR